MKKYSHDYSKVADADSLLHCALRSLASDARDIAQDCVEEARGLLQEYLSQDNMVEDNDVYDGWYRCTDVDQILIS